MDSLNTSERIMVDSTADVTNDGLIRTIVSEIDRLQPVPFDNTTATFDSLLLNHSRFDSVYLDKMLAKIGPELPELNVGSELDDKPLSGSDIRSSTTNLSRVASSESNFVEENCVEMSPAGNDFRVQENSTVSVVDLVAMKTQLQQQQDMILELQKSDSNLKDQVTQQHVMILELRKNSSHQQQQQYEMILELRNQLNTLTEAHRVNETLLDERLLATQVVNQDLTTEITDRTQMKIAEINIVTTNERMSISDSGQMGQLQEIEGVQSGAEECNERSVIITGANDISLDVEQDKKSDRVEQSANSTLSSEGDNFIHSEGSVHMKHQIRMGDGKRIRYDLESTDASHKNCQNPRKKLKSYFCGECSKRFNSMSHFTNHLRVHSGEKPFQCKDCNAAFSESGNLNKHRRTHSNEKPYKCKECDAAFRELGNLKTHQRIHSNEKPYKCKECDASFRQSNNLKTHQRTHCDEKPFMCDICKKSFTRKSTLATHVDIHNGNKSHECNVCQKAFRFLSSLKKHLKVHPK